MNSFRYEITFKTRAANIPRRLFRIKQVELFLRGLIERAGAGSWARKMVPPEYLYRRPSYRLLTRDGLRYRLDLSQVIDHDFYFYRQSFVPEAFYRRVRPGAVIFDIGANIGLAACRAACIVEHGEVHAFEPDPVSFTSLKYNVELNGLRNVRLHPLAVGSSTGSRSLHEVHPHNRGMNRFLPMGEESAGSGAMVPVTTVDYEVERLGLKRLDLIKVDVEGFELFVLEGAKKSIARFRPVLVLELVDKNLMLHQASSRRIVQLLEEFGYSVRDAVTGLPVAGSDPMETDVVCLPENP